MFAGAFRCRCFAHLDFEHLGLWLLLWSGHKESLALAHLLSLQVADEVVKVQLCPLTVFCNCHIDLLVK